MTLAIFLYGTPLNAVQFVYGTLLKAARGPALGPKIGCTCSQRAKTFWCRVRKCNDSHTAYDIGSTVHRGTSELYIAKRKKCISRYLRTVHCDTSELHIAVLENCTLWYLRTVHCGTSELYIAVFKNCTSWYIRLMCYASKCTHPITDVITRRKAGAGHPGT